jgi:3-dehydroquinate synthase
MLKHGLIKDAEYFKQLADYNSVINDSIEKYIYRSIIIKNEVVKKDPNEIDERKVLNFGHTLGHAIESYFLKQKRRKTLLHGEAVAAGMILEACLSMKLKGLSVKETDYIAKSINSIFPKIKFSRPDISTILDLVKHDKKNVRGKNKFTLLSKVGEASINNEVSKNLLKFAFEYYQLI